MIAKLCQFYICLPLKAASAFMFFLVQSAHLARPMTTDATSPEAALATAIAISTAQTPRSLCGVDPMLLAEQVELATLLPVTSEVVEDGWRARRANACYI